MQQILIRRSKRKNNFTIINNEILTNEVLSFEAKGILCFILSLPDNFVIHKNWLMDKFKIGRTYLDRCFNELSTAGYMASFDFERENGKFCGKGFIFYDENICLKSADTAAGFTHRTAAGLPLSVNEHLIRTNNTEQELIRKQEQEGVVLKIEISQELQDDLTNYFGFGKQDLTIQHPHEKKHRDAFQFLINLTKNNEVEKFKKSFLFYKKFKDKSGQSKHSWITFLDTGWDAENWEHKFKEFEKQKPNGQEKIDPDNILNLKTPLDHPSRKPWNHLEWMSKEDIARLPLKWQRKPE